MNVSLGDYLAELRRLVHDPQDLAWPLADKTTNINTAMCRRDLDTGGNRTLITFPLVVGTEHYSFSTLGNTSVFDVVGINLLQAGTRRLMDNHSFTLLNTLYRTSTTSQQEPIAWAKYGATTVYFGPIPGLAYSTEWDCCQTGVPLVLSTDNDALPYPFTEPVAFYAGYLCKYNERQYEEAAAFKEQYYDALRTIESSRAGMLPSGYPIIGR